jgi:predicted ATPase/class 3 adenylate cyclase
MRGDAPVEVGGPQPRRALAVLLVHANEVVSSDRLVDVLWGDEPPPSATHTLQALVSRLRGTIGEDRVETRAPGYRLRVATGQVDASRFEELVRVGLGSSERPEIALGVFDEALGLWRGSPYAEFASEEFAAAEVARLVELRARAIEERSAALLELSRPEEVVGVIEAEIAAEPFRERLRALLMLALARAGRPVESLRAYDEFRRFLADEVGVVPSPGLQALNDDIVRQHPDVGWAGLPTKGPDTADLPSGTVSFLFTDVEDSTRVWGESPVVMRHAMPHHDELLRDAVESHDGFIVKNAGDGFRAVFATAHDAVTAAVTAQRGLLADDRNITKIVRVRMGIHTGEAEVRDGDYSGGAVNRAERLMSVAHGGQIVVSAATEELLHHVLPEKYGFVDLGEHRLRDLARPEHLYQVLHPQLPRDFPSLQTLDTYPGNLPLQLTSFVGREDEIVQTIDALGHARLVTLTGVGGVGKTRLAVQVAAEVLPEFRDGAWLCELATAGDEVLMFHTVADAVGARQREGLSMADSVVEFLRDRELLLVLDNCEHLLVDAARLALAIMQRCPSVRILATSRAGLGVSGEQLVVLGSLPLVLNAVDPSAIASSDAVRLFVDRASAARSGFMLGAANLDAVAEICRRLDGIALAIELAAARVTALSPVEIAAHLDERFRLLAGARRSGVERHQTLRATVEWSYALLDDTERLVFDRLGVFVGSFDADAAYAVVAGDELEYWAVLDALTHLVEKSMVVAGETDDGTTRYWLLETLRAFAREKLDATGDTDRWRRLHASHYAEFCEQVGPQLVGPVEDVAGARVDTEVENIWAALRWGLDSPAQEDADLALRMVIALTRAPGGAESRAARWGLQEWADSVLTAARSSALPGRAQAISLTAMWRTNLVYDVKAAEELGWEALRAPSAAEVPQSIALSYYTLATVRYWQGQTAEALELLVEGHQALDAAGAPGGCHGTLHALSSLLHVAAGELEAAGREAEAYLEIARFAGSALMLQAALAYAGSAWFSQDPDRALAALEDSIALGRVAATNSMAFAGAAQLRARAGDRIAALTHLRGAIVADHDMGAQASAGSTLERAIVVLARLGDDELAATCAGIVQAEIVASFRTLPQADRSAARVAERLGPDAYAAAQARGAGLTQEEVAPMLLTALNGLLAAEEVT